MSDMLSEVMNLHRLNPQVDLEDIIAEVSGLNDRYQDDDDEMDLGEQADIIENVTHENNVARIARMLGELETAGTIVDVFGEDVLEQALDALEAEEELVGEAHKKHGVIKLGVNKTRVGDNRHSINRTHRSFNAIVHKSDREFQRLSGLHKEDFQVNSGAKAILEARLTPAQRSIQTHNVNEPSVRTMLPKEFSDSGLADIQTQTDNARAYNASTKLPTDDIAIRTKDYTVAASLPAEFQPKIAGAATDYMDASGRMKSPTKGGKTLDKGNPKFVKPQTDQGNVSYNQPSTNAGDAASGVSGSATYQPAFKDEARQKQYDSDNRNLLSRRDGNQPPLSNR